MTKPLTRLKALGSVLDMRYVKRYLLILDSRYHLYILDATSKALVKKIRLAAEGKNSVHRYSKTLMIAPGGEVIVSFNGSNRLGLFKLGKGVISQEITSWHRSDLEVVTVSKEGRLYATGGSDGKVFLYHSLDSVPFGSFEPRGEYISSLAFSADGRLLASSAFDKVTRIYDLNRHLEIASFSSSETVEHAVFFDEGRKLYAVTRNGGSIVFDVALRASISEKILFDVWPTTVALSQNGRVAAVGTKGNGIVLVKLFENKKVYEWKTPVNGITQVKLHNEKMCISGIDGTVLEYDSTENKAAFEAGIREKDFHRAKEALDQNGLLYLHPMLESFDASWSAVLKEAIRRISIGECDAGCSIVQPFLDDPERVEEFNFYLAQKEVFVNFITHVEQGRYKDAYMLAEKEQYLKRISQYDEMEKLWERAFKAAQKTLEANPENGRRAREMLKAFARVGTKEKIIRQLVENGHIFAQAAELVRSMRFADFFTLVETHDFLKEAGIYKKVMQVGENLYQKLIRCEEERAFERYYQIAETLKHFPDYSESISVGVERGRIKERFIRSVAEDDLYTAYSLLEKHDHLVLEGEYDHLLQDFEHIYAEAQKRVGHGAEALELKELLSAYITIPYWQDRIAQVMRKGYINELRLLDDDGDATSQLEEAVLKYIRLFSKDDELINCMRQKGLEQWLEAIPEGNIIWGYRQSGFPNSIVC